MRSIELFAGAGGLGMGLELSGFEPDLVVEWDRWACDSIRENIQNGYPLVKDWPLFQGDVRNVDYNSFENIDLISGGPPCQPFSLGGKSRGNRDNRDMFPAAVEAVRKLSPKAFIFENVKGITRNTFKNYFEYIRLQLTYPNIKKRAAESWFEHLSRLEKLYTSGTIDTLKYNVVTRLINAADYGVPQKRERVFIVGFRADLHEEWSFPQPTHSFDTLLHDQWNTGEYWVRHGLNRKIKNHPPTKLQSRLHKLSRGGANELKPWRTVRDAISDLPNPELATEAMWIRDHKYQPGAKSYPGHTGSPLDLPAKTLKAGAHGVPGGENMLLLPNGEVRYFTIRESARLQTFPDGYVFHGSWSETMRQLGNAVPVNLAHVIGKSVALQLLLRDEQIKMNTQKVLAS